MHRINNLPCTTGRPAHPRNRRLEDTDRSGSVTCRRSLASCRGSTAHSHGQRATLSPWHRSTSGRARPCSADFATMRPRWGCRCPQVARPPPGTPRPRSVDRVARSTQRAPALHAWPAYPAQGAQPAPQTARRATAPPRSCSGLGTGVLRSLLRRADTTPVASSRYSRRCCLHSSPCCPQGKQRRPGQSRYDAVRCRADAGRRREHPRGRVQDSGRVSLPPWRVRHPPASEAPPPESVPHRPASQAHPSGRVRLPHLSLPLRPGPLPRPCRPEPQRSGSLRHPCPSEPRRPGWLPLPLQWEPHRCVPVARRGDRPAKLASGTAAVAVKASRRKARSRRVA